MSRVINRKKEKRRNMIRFIFISIAIIILYSLGTDIYYESGVKTRENEEAKQDITIQQESVVEIKQIENQVVIEKEEIPSVYKGYPVIAKLEIPKIEVNTVVLAEFSKDALYECVTKYWGGQPNEVGNFCIAGHNSKRKNMFTDLKKLEIGDTFTLSDAKRGKMIYEIYDIYKVKPNNVACLSQETGGKIETTFITCTNDSAYRIIVKARVKEG